MNSRFSIANKTRRRIPRTLLYRVFSIASKKRMMEVSLVFLGDRAMRSVNKRWHKRTAQSNVLAFRLTELVGEVVINSYEAEREARQAGVSSDERIVYLFTHGLLHLYGYDHHTERGAFQMKQHEEEIMEAVSVRGKLKTF